jgi:hypothetical protein
VERFRVKFGETDKPWTAATLPVVGFGVFLMTRQQMLGIRERAETLAGKQAGDMDRAEEPVMAVGDTTETVVVPAA